MGKHEKKKVKKAPVPTGNDYRAQTRENDDMPTEQSTAAPDGISGTWD